jgi:hypothetical protein
MDTFAEDQINCSCYLRLPGFDYWQGTEISFLHHSVMWFFPRDYSGLNLKLVALFRLIPKSRDGFCMFSVLGNDSGTGIT